MYKAKVATHQDFTQYNRGVLPLFSRVQHACLTIWVRLDRKVQLTADVLSIFTSGIKLCQHKLLTTSDHEYVLHSPHPLLQ